jgi:small conductance mechanosensitive channel
MGKAAPLMPSPFKRDHHVPVMKPAMFETRSEEWEAAGIKLDLSKGTIRKARGRLVFSVLALIATIVGHNWALHKYDTTPHAAGPYTYRLNGILHTGTRHVYYWLLHSRAPFALVAIIIVLTLGWLISQDLSRLAPTIFKRMDPATAGTVEFVIRLLAVAATVLGAISIAGVSAQVVAVGGGFTSIIVGLAAQPVLANLFSGMVLLSAQPFRLGQRIRLQSGTISIQEGTVVSLGLLYTTLSRGVNQIMIPNSLVMGAVVVPIRQPAPVDVRVKLNPGVRPSQAQAILDSELAEDTLGATTVVLEEINGDDVFIRVRATPEDSDLSGRLADEIIKVLASVTGGHQTLNGGRYGNGSGSGSGSGTSHSSPEATPDSGRRRT